VKKLTLLLGVIALVLTLSVVTYPIEMKGMVGLGAHGGLWKPVLTDHSDIWTVGFDGGATVKYGILKNLAIGVTGSYLYTWEAKLEGSKIDDGAGFTFSKHDSAWTYRHIMIEAAAYYEAQQCDLGRRFLASVQDSINRIVINPQLYPIVELDVRRCLTRTFPFGVFFEIVPTRSK